MPLAEAPCETCGEPTTFKKLCNNCWEVERRLGLYLRSEKGRAFVQEALVATVAGLASSEGWDHVNG